MGSVRYDVENLFAWTFIETGLITDFDGVFGRYTLFDNGIEWLEHMTPSSGQRFRIQRWDNPDSTGPGAAPWTSIDTSYDENGAVTEIVRIDDDGTTRHSTFEDGLLGSVTDTDTGGDVHPWESITTTYVTFDGASVRGSRQTAYDNGDLREENFSPGSGLLSHRRFEYQDGGVRDEYFQDGLVSRRLQEDGSDDRFVWSSINTSFDDQGRLSSRRTEFDAGNTRSEVFEDGVPTTRIDEDVDAWRSASNDLFHWRTQATTFDEHGELASRYTRFDTGTDRFEVYEDGIRRYFYEADAGVATAAPVIGYPGVGVENPPDINHPDDLSDLFDWQMREVLYDATGATTHAFVAPDEGNWTLTIYENGRRAEVQYYDVDGDDDWLAIRLTFDGEGALTGRTEYPDLESVPDDMLVVPEPEPVVDPGDQPGINT